MTVRDSAARRERFVPGVWKCKNGNSELTPKAYAASRRNSHAMHCSEATLVRQAEDSAAFSPVLPRRRPHSLLDDLQPLEWTRRARDGRGSGCQQHHGLSRGGTLSRVRRGFLV